MARSENLTKISTKPSGLDQVPCRTEYPACVAIKVATVIIMKVGLI